MAIRNFVELKAGLDKDAFEIDELVGVVTRRVAAGILRRVVMASPTDTGRFRGNWQVSTTEIPLSELGTLDLYGNPTIAEGLAEIARAGPYPVIHIVNNVPYAARLNDGWSKQAPAGFVENAIDAEMRPITGGAGNV